MRNFFIIIILFVVFSCQTQEPVEIEKMTTEQWEYDINYVNKKIQREFASYDPNVKVNFDKNAKKLIQQLGTLDAETIAIEIGRLLASLEDGHTEMSILQENANLSRLPIASYFFKEGLYIFAAHKKHKDLVGSQILTIGDDSIPQVVEKLKDVMTYDNIYEIYQTGPSFISLPSVLQYLKISEKDSVGLTLKTLSNDTVRVHMSPVPRSEYGKGPWERYSTIHQLKTQLRDQNSDKNYWYEYLPDQKTMYFYYGRVNNQKGQKTIKKTVNEMFEIIDKVQPEKFVVDLRDNRGGNYNKSIPLIKALKKRDFLNKKGKVYVISGRTTFSAALVTSIFFKKQTNAILIGEPSRGHPNKTDNVEYMYLPNSQLKIEYTTKVKKHWPELGTSDHLPVDIRITPSFKYYQQGKDEVLEYILQQ